MNSSFRPSGSTPVGVSEVPTEEAQIMVGWLLQIILEGPAHEFDKELAVKAAKRFLGIIEQ